MGINWGTVNIFGMLIGWLTVCAFTAAALSFGWHLFKPKK